MTESDVGPRFFLGLDSSTQSLTAIVIDLGARSISHRARVHFDQELPQWGTNSGQLPNDDPTLGHAPPLLWVEALERIFERLRDSGAPLSLLRGMSVSGQQHGSVYLNRAAPRIFERLHPGLPLTDQLRPALSRETSPIWTDSSTTEQCRQIRQALGGVEASVRLTGSDIFERFTGPQIRKFAQQEPDAYEHTASIALVSSFVTSVLCGHIAPIDWGDGSGMNLMDLHERHFSPIALDATAVHLGDRLPALVPPWSCVGPIAPWLVERHGLAEDCQVVVGSGDNPCSLIGLGLVEDGQAAISFGTSDTYFQLGSSSASGQIDPETDTETPPETERFDATGAGHLFVSPTGTPMALLCFRNGSLAREKVRDHFGLDWQGFSHWTSQSPAAAGGFFFPWFEPEIVPRGAHGVRAFGDLDWNDRSPESAGRHCRALLETQLLSMRFHSAFLDNRPDRVLVTGGGSQNAALRQLTADVFQATVETVETPDSAALGAALRAAHGALHRKPSSAVAWSQLIDGFCQPDQRIEPTRALAPLYDHALRQLAEHLRSLP
jgi:xylulokinase